MVCAVDNQARNINLRTVQQKVIIVGPAYPLRGGIANFNEALYHAFAASGAQVEIVSFSLQYPGILFPGKSQEEGDSRPDPGLAIRPLVNSINPFSWLRAARYINRKAPDLVVVRFWLPFMAPALGTILRRLNSRIRILALVDNAIPHEKRIGDRPLTRYFMRAPHAFVAMSRAVVNDLKHFAGNRPVRFVPHPVYNIYGDALPKVEARRILGLDATDRILLFFGFVRKYKGLELMLDALADKRLEDAGVKLMIAGEFYDDKARYLQKIADLGISDRVLLHDHFIPSSEIAHYFCAADMVTQTYLSATQSGVTQIAYHFGRPMLVTDVGGLGEIVPHEKVGYVVPVDAEAIATAVSDFYRQNRETAMSEAVCEKAGDFSWEHMVDEMNDLYKTIKH